MRQRLVGLAFGALAAFILPWLGVRADDSDAARVVQGATGVVPVWRLPVITPISRAMASCGCKDDDDRKCTPPEKYCAADSCDKRLCKQFYFERPAHFPLPRFSDLGAPIDVEGAMIYEGMSLFIYKNGAFETNFIVATKADPVTIRLAFKICPPTDSASEPFQLTIPPVVIQPDSRRERKVDDHHWHVRYVGYSPFLERFSQAACKNCKSPDNNAADCKFPCTVTRQGSARFGCEPGQNPSIYQY